MSTQGQPSWRIGSSGGEVPVADDDRSPFVVLSTGVHVEVTDLAALQAALTALDGPPKDELDERLRSIPANVVGRLFGHAFRPAQVLEQLPGVVVRSGWSAADADRDVPPHS